MIFNNKLTKFTNIILLLIIILIVLIPRLESKNIFNLSLVTNGYLNTFILIVIIFIFGLEDYRIGLFLFLLVFSLIYIDPNNVIEGFIPYYK